MALFARRRLSRDCSRSPLHFSGQSWNDQEAVSLVNVLDVLLDRIRSHVLGAYVRRIVIADENESAYRVIRRLRAARLSLAAVIDAQKQLLGIVTVEDLIKRLIRSA